MNDLDFSQSELQSICSEHMVDKLYLFGSAVSGKLNAASDIDFVVRFSPFDISSHFQNYLKLKEKLQSLFNRDVDLVEEQTLSNPFLIRSIDKNKQLIYG